MLNFLNKELKISAVRFNISIRKILQSYLCILAVIYLVNYFFGAADETIYQGSRSLPLLAVIIWAWSLLLLIIVAVSMMLLLSYSDVSVIKIAIIGMIVLFAGEYLVISFYINELLPRILVVALICFTTDSNKNKPLSP